MANIFIWLLDATVERDQSSSTSPWCHQQITSPTYITKIVVANIIRQSKKDFQNILGVERAFAFQRFGINPDGLAQAVNLDDFLGMKKRMTNGLIGQNRLSENSMISQGGFKATYLFTCLARRLWLPIDTDVFARVRRSTVPPKRY